ncbi:MAG: hypothetical protein QOD63_715 [Actinomycetota bacterium]|nr:hypothetical protein [Actinomycetota bacterium]
MTTTVVEVDDDRWDDLLGEDDPDPYCGRSYLAAVTAAARTRAVLIVSEGPGWRVRYPLVLEPLPGGRWLARTPEYGGPDILLDGTDAGSSRSLEAAQGSRRSLDEALVSLGVVSEVFLLSPWLHDRCAVGTAWAARETKPICLVLASGQEGRWARLRKGRRSDITRARRELALTWGPLDDAGAQRFAGHYRLAMDRLGAAERWRFDDEWFRTLAERANGRVLVATAEGPEGGATALFLTGRNRAAYYLASRWGTAAGGPSLVLWTGIEELAGAGVRGITLGGGAADGDDDPVLAFKRSFADTEVPLLVGARIFDPVAHDQAVASGLARPLPPGAVAA